MNPRTALSSHPGVGATSGVLLGLVLGLPSCTPPMESAPVPSGETTRALVALHEDVGVAGLDDRRFSPETYWEVVLPVVSASEALRVEEVGRSAEGRPIREVTFGTGPVPVLLWSQMHGDESTASMALADIFRLLGSAGPLARRLGERLTLHFVPVLNPDGAARFQRRNAQGVDVNRDARRLATPEGRALKEVRDRVEPEYAFNLHDQNVGTRVGSSDRGVAIALLAPAFDEARSLNARRARAMRVAAAIRMAVEPLVNGHIARYDDTFNPRAFGDLMATWGASAVLIESGGWEGDPQKQFLRRVNFVGILSALDAIAQETLDDVSMAAYTSLPRNGRRVGDLLVVGGTFVPPGLPPLTADVLVDFERPLLMEGGTVADVGDLGGYEARDTIQAYGLYLIPTAEMMDADGALEVGAPARFVAARRPDGGGEVWRFEGSPPASLRNR
ncbi:MAG: M14 family zinc carboxypeptidase [Gemmatimonadota bacterium]